MPAMSRLAGQSPASPSTITVSAPQPVAGPVAGRAAHDEQAAAHAMDLAFARAAEKIPGMAEDFDPPAAHAGTGIMAGASGDDERAACEQPPGVLTDVAIDVKLPALHVLADAIEAIGAAFDDDLVGGGRLSA